MSWKTMTLRDAKGSPLTNAEMDANLQSVLDFMNGVALPNGPHNLDDYDVPGVYGQNATAGAQAGTNYPVDPVAGTPVAGILKVWKGYAQDGTNISAHQEYRTYYRTRPTIFYRNKDAGGWGDWVRLATYNEAMTRVALTAGTDANTLTTDNTFYTWATSAVMSGGSNWPPAPASSVGFMEVVVLQNGAVIQTVTFRPATTRRTITYQRCSSVNVWGDWYVVGSISLASDLPTSNCGDVYVDGDGWYTWGTSTYVRASVAKVLPTTAHDLNTYTVPGVYWQNQSSAATLANNYPAAGVTCFLEVQNFGNATLQEISMRTSPFRKWWRVQTGNTTSWSSWKEYADMASAMTHVFLTAATDANTLTADNTWWSWVSATVWDQNFPPHPVKVGGFIQTYYLSAANIVQIATLNAGGGSRNVVYQRQANGSTLTWTQWRLMSPLSTANHLPAVSVGDAYVDGLGWHRWNATLSKYTLVPATPKQREGLGTEWAGTTSVLVKPGSCASVGGEVLLDLSQNSTRVIQNSGAYSHGLTGNGLLTGARVANTWYYIFLLQRDSDGVVAVCFDSNPTCANRPSGYTHYRRIGSVRTDGVNNIWNYTQTGNKYTFDPHVSIYLNDTFVAGAVYTIGNGAPNVEGEMHYMGWMSEVTIPTTLDFAYQLRGGGYSGFMPIQNAYDIAYMLQYWSAPSIYPPAAAPTLRVRSSNYGKVTLRCQGYTDYFVD